MLGSLFTSRNIIKSLARFCISNTIKLEGYLIVAHNVPTEWSEKDLQKHIDPEGTRLAALQILYNRLGTNSGKAIVQCNDKESLQKCLNAQLRYGLVLKHFECLDPPFDEVEAARVNNIDSDITDREMRRVAEDFGEVQEIEMPVYSDGKNRGYALIKFKKRDDLKKFIEEANGLPLLGKPMAVCGIVVNTSKQPTASTPLKTATKMDEIYSQVLQKRHLFEKENDHNQSNNKNEDNNQADSKKQ